MVPLGLTPRDSALAFTQGVACGWQATDLVLWVEEHLVQPGRFQLSHGASVEQVWEHQLGVAKLQRVASADAVERAATSQVVGILQAARSRVVETLRQSITTSQRKFVNEALFAHRVARASQGGAAHWSVTVSEQVALSDQVLALFAADALASPDEYDRDLSVCNACGSIHFYAAAERNFARLGCPVHPTGSLSQRVKPNVSGTRRKTNPY